MSSYIELNLSHNETGNKEKAVLRYGDGTKSNAEKCKILILLGPLLTIEYF